MNTILYATDFSSPSLAAFPVAVAMARDYGAKLLIAHIRPIPVAAFAEGSFAFVDPEDGVADIRQRLEEKFNSSDAGVEVEYFVGEGDPATELLDLARARRCDLIVIGTHGRTGIMRLLAGSVAEQMLRHAPCPVLTIRPPKPETVPPSVNRPRSRVLTPEEAFTIAPFIP